MTYNYKLCQKIEKGSNKREKRIERIDERVKLERLLREQKLLMKRLYDENERIKMKIDDPKLEELISNQNERILNFIKGE